MSIFLEYHISEAVLALQKGGILKFPSDTVWGLACTVGNEENVNKLVQLQQFSEQKLHELLISDEFMLKKYILKMHPRIETLLHYCQRPLTVVHNHTMNLPAHLLPEVNKIGFRLARNQFCESVIHDLGCPLYFLPFHRVGANNENKLTEIMASQVDYEVPNSCYDPLEIQKSRVVSYDEMGRLFFHN